MAGEFVINDNGTDFDDSNNSSFQKGIPDNTTGKISQLEKALDQTKCEINNACSENSRIIISLSLICIVIVGFIYCLGKELYYYKDYPPTWTWEMIYFTVTRLVLVSAVFSIASFFFNLLKSYLHIYQRNRHRQLIINSMASIVGSGSTYYANPQEIYDKLLDIVIHFDSTGISDNDKKDFELSQIKIVDLLKDIKGLINK